MVARGKMTTLRMSELGSSQDSQESTGVVGKSMQVNTLKAPTCGTSILRVLSPRAKGRKGYPLKSHDIKPCATEEQSLLVRESESVKTQRMRGTGYQKVDFEDDEECTPRSPLSHGTNSFSPMSSPERKGKGGGFFGTLSSPKSKTMENSGESGAASYLMLQFNPSEESQSPSKRDQSTFSKVSTDSQKSTSMNKEISANATGEKPDNSKEDSASLVVLRDGSAKSSSSSSSSSATTKASSKQGGFGRRSSKKKASSQWSVSLPAVEEESTLDEIMSSHTAPEIDNDELSIMKVMMQKQQESIQAMVRENQRVCEELSQYRKLFAEANANKVVSQQGTGRPNSSVDEDGGDRPTSQTETRWLMEEIKSLRAEMSRLQKATEEQSSHSRSIDMSTIETAQDTVSTISHNDKNGTFLMDDGDEDDSLHQFKEIRKEIQQNKQVYGDILPNDSIFDVKSEDEFSEAFPANDDESRDDYMPVTTPRGTEAVVSQREANKGAKYTPKPLLGPGLHDQDDESAMDFHVSARPQHPHSSYPTYASSTRSTFSTRSEDSHSSASRSKEEVNLFKNRLKEIQTKREMRKVRGGSVGSYRSARRFD